jgi:molybdopterin synthase catalytic subunit
MVRLQTERIDTLALTEQVRTPASGAIVLFLGTVREMTADQRTVALEYEAYPGMAEKMLAQVEAEVREKWPVRDVALVHRLGRLELAEVSVAVAVACPHRADAFAAARYAIDRVKEIVPIWKKDIGPTGAQAWVHPTS